jgi:hypothetical protein
MNTTFSYGQCGFQVQFIQFAKDANESLGTSLQSPVFTGICKHDFCLIHCPILALH